MVEYSELRQKLEVDTLNGNAEGLAFLTHFLQNHTNGVSKSYKAKAVSYYNQINEDLSIAAEPAMS